MTAASAPTAPDVVFGLSSAHIGARALHVVAELGVADALADEPRTTEELANDVGADPDALLRLLRLLEGHSVFASDRREYWRHTPASRLLRADAPTSLRAFARMLGCPPMYESLAILESTVRTGRAGIYTLDPGGLFGYLQNHPDQLAIFNEAMTGQAHGDIAAVLTSHDFSAYHRIADVGGGRGHLIAAILAATENATGVLYDLPAVVAQADHIPRLEIAAGDFFTDPLPACDAYLLKHILHDWNDIDAASILKAVARAGSRTEATVLVLEWVLPDGSEPHVAKTLDVLMLATTGGRERTRTGYQVLLDNAGIELVTVHPTPNPLSIIEGRIRPGDS